MTIIPAAEIPTISLLYRLKKLLPANGDSESLTESSQSYNDRIGLIRGDITKLEVDAIVNAANRSLLGGGGVDGAIHSAAGPGLLKECRKLKGCDTGDAKITDAYNLPCKKVIHAVGPIYSRAFEEDSARDLACCYTTSLDLAVENNCKSIAFSALSTGIYGYPSNDAAPVAIRAVKSFLEGEDGDKIDKIVFTTFVMKDVEAYNYWLPRFFPSTEPVIEEEWEEIEGGDSAENGPAEKVTPDGEELEENTATTSTIKLPDVPAGEPEDGGRALKKQKAND